MSVWNPEKIKLKRYNNNITDAALQNEDISFGEPVIISNDGKTYLGLCDVTTDSTSTISDSKFSKVYNKNIVDKSVFFKTVAAGTVLTDDKEAELTISSSSISYNDSTVDSELNAIINGDISVSKSKSIEILDTTSTAYENFYVLGEPEEIEQEEVKPYQKVYRHLNVYFTNAGVLFGAAWNDFAEHRLCTTDTPGTCVVESVGGILIPSEAYKQGGAYIISDTFGMVIGDNAENSAPVAVAGRVLAFVENKDKLQPGDALKTAPGGKLAKMSRREIRRYPDRIVGYVSEIPTYETWNNVKVNGRIWVKI